MTETDLQQLLQNQTSSGLAESLDTSSMLQEAVEPLIPVLTTVFLVGIVLTVIIVIFFIINIVQKQRQHSAIMRIDRNLQKLIDAKGLSEQTPVAAPIEAPVSTTPPTS